MTKPLIIVYDDEREMRQRYAEKLEEQKVISGAFDIEPIDENDFRKQIKVLKARQLQSREGMKFEINSLFDKASILIIDQDLIRASDELSFLTGELIAYLSRCYSHCGLIININQYGYNTFDLTLRGHPESYSDINIGGAQLHNEGLWGGKRNGFRPWYWPEIPIFLEQHYQRIKDVQDNLTKPVFTTLGFEDPTIFPKSMCQFVGTNPVETTFKDFVLYSSKGLRRKDVINNEEMLARIAAARISHWLELVVLPGQNILVDAPHLVSRFPSLLQGKRSLKEVWNQTTHLDRVDKFPLDHSKIDKHRFKKSYWLSRPVWFWKDLVKSQDIDEVLNPWKREIPEFLFCEDSSTFEKKELCREFTSDVDSPYTQRFVHKKPFQGVDYDPGFRLLTE